jgi:hypothetical protein
MSHTRFVGEIGSLAALAEALPNPRMRGVSRMRADACITLIETESDSEAYTQRMVLG